MQNSEQDYNFNHESAFTSIMLNEFSQTPLLKRDREIRLFKQRDECRLLLQDPEADEATSKWAEDKIKQLTAQAIMSNCRLVLSIAKNYLDTPVRFTDLAEEGVLGLMKAVDKFEVERGYKFSTYATWWIRQAVTRAVGDQSRIIRVPIHQHDRIKYISKTANEFMGLHGRKPTVVELAELTGLSEEKIQDIMKTSLPVISLDWTNADDREDESDMYTVICDDSDIEADVNRSLLREKLFDILRSFSPRECKIMCLRFGLEDGRSYTLEEVGAKFGLTRERIRQIEAKTMRRLRHARYTRILRPFLEGG